MSFTCVPNELLDEHGAQLGPIGIAVYMMLARYANREGGDAWPSVKTIAAAIGVTPPPVWKALKALAALGYIEIENRWRPDGGRTSNAYTLGKHPVKPQAPVKEIDSPYKPSLQPPVNDVYTINTHIEQDTPSGASAPQPVPFAEQVRLLIVEAQSAKNKPAALRKAFVALYGEQRDVPEFGYLMRTAGQVGGPARLVELMAQHAAQPPVGDVLAYIVASAKRQGKPAQAEGPSSASRMKVLA